MDKTKLQGPASTCAVQYEVDCYDLVSTNQVTLIDHQTGEVIHVPATKWEWKNSFYANVTYIFRGQEFTVLAEVCPDYKD